MNSAATERPYRPISEAELWNMAFMDAMTIRAPADVPTPYSRGQPWTGFSCWKTLGDKWAAYNAAVRSKFFDCPYGGVGGRLWIREAWTAAYLGLGSPRFYIDLTPDERQTLTPDVLVFRDALGGTEPPGHEYLRVPRWESAVGMPRWAARTVLDILDVRIARLHDSATSAVANGLGSRFAAAWDRRWRHRNAYELNPWVWVLTVKHASPLPPSP